MILRATGVLVLSALVLGCVPKPHHYCHSGLVQQDGGYFYERDAGYLRERDGGVIYERDGGYFYERDGGYFYERDGGYFRERDGGYIWERDLVSFPIVCRGGVRCEESDGSGGTIVRCE